MGNLDLWPIHLRSAHLRSTRDSRAHPDMGSGILSNSILLAVCGAQQQSIRPVDRRGSGAVTRP